MHTGIELPVTERASLSAREPASQQEHGPIFQARERLALQPYTPEAGARIPDGPRMLLISQLFTPNRAVGALRWEKLARFAAERGIGLDVVTLDPQQLVGADFARLSELPPTVRAFGVPFDYLPIQRVQDAALRAYRSLRPRTQATRPEATGRHELATTKLSRFEQARRALFAWQEFAVQGRWARRARRVALRIIDPARHVAIISSGPPHMAHEAGRLVAARTRLPHVVDMRDPWSLVQRVPTDIASPVWFALARHYERRVVEQAALVVANTSRSRDALRELYPAAADRMLAIMNGTDEEPVPPSRHGEKFIIAFAGSIYLDRDPRLLFRGAAQLIRTLRLTPADFGFRFIGDLASVGGASVTQIARDEGLEGFVEVGPPRSRAQAMEFLAEGTMLLSLPQDSDLAVPSKIFEYSLFDAWLLVFTNEGSATDLTLRGSGADVLAHDDLAGIVDTLTRRYQEFRAGVRPVAIGRDGRFSRRTQANMLLDAIEQFPAVQRARASFSSAAETA